MPTSRRECLHLQPVTTTPTNWKWIQMSSIHRLSLEPIDAAVNPKRSTYTGMVCGGRPTSVNVMVRACGVSWKQRLPSTRLLEHMHQSLASLSQSPSWHPSCNVLISFPQQKKLLCRLNSFLWRRRPCHHVHYRAVTTWRTGAAPDITAGQNQQHYVAGLSALNQLMDNLRFHGKGGRQDRMASYGLSTRSTPRGIELMNLDDNDNESSIT